LSKRLLLLPCILVLSALALAACGRSDGAEGEVEEVIEVSATSTDPTDCLKLQSQQFMEQISQESGKAAVQACEEEAENEEGAKSVSVSSVEVSDSSATAEAALSGGSLDGQTVEVELVEDGGQWKMDEVVKFTDFDQDELVEGLEANLLQNRSEVNPRFANCLIEAFKQGSQAEVEDLLFGGGLEEAFEACSSGRST
jgi:hypothetical protein